MEEGIIKRLMTSLKCDICGRHYDAPDVHILGHRNELWFFRVLCSNCRSACLIAASIKESRLDEAVNDLTRSELHELFNAESVCENDLLDMHCFLKDFDGNFSAIFHKD